MIATLQRLARRRGFLLVTGLLVVIVMLLIGMGLVGSEASRYRAALRTSESGQARQLALAGLEDARAKLEMDCQFPPPPAAGPSGFAYSAGPYDPSTGQSQPIFTYTETLPNPDTPPVNCTYSVTVDSSACTDRFWDQDITKSYDSSGPRQVIVITSIGTIGDPDQPTAQYQIRAELDCSLYTRVSGSTAPNPRYFHYTHITDDDIP